MGTLVSEQKTEQKKNFPPIKKAMPAQQKAIRNSPAYNLQSKIGNQAFGTLIQASLKVSRSSDVHEQEADRIASQVVSGSSVKTPVINKTASVSGFTQKSTKNLLPVRTQNPVSSLPALTRLSGGIPLPDTTRKFFEQKMGYDFSNVRLHTSASDAILARSINANAYTSGKNIVFEEGKYNPYSTDGKMLIAHELTHVVQQGEAKPIAEEALSLTANTGAGQQIINRNEKNEDLPGYKKVLNLGVDIKNSVFHFVEKGIDTTKDLLLEKIKNVLMGMKGYEAICLILKKDPLTDTEIMVTGEKLLAAGLGLLPGGIGDLIIQGMKKYKLHDQASSFIFGKYKEISRIVAKVEYQINLIKNNPVSGVLADIVKLVEDTVHDIICFMEKLVSSFISMIKNVVIKNLAGFIKKYIPGIYPLLSVLLGFDPETFEKIERNGTTILSAFLELSEDGSEQKRLMKETGTFKKIVDWIDRGIETFSKAYEMLAFGIFEIWNSISIENLLNPIETFTRIYDFFSKPVKMVCTFIFDAGLEILRVIKNALLGKISQFAKTSRGFDLLCVIIGEDPLTGDKVPFTVENVVKGFMCLMDDGLEQFGKMKETGAIQKIADKIEGAVARLKMTPQEIIALFTTIWEKITIKALANIVDCVTMIITAFGEPISRLVNFVIDIVMIVIESILVIMKFPVDLIQKIISKSIKAFGIIKKNIAGFLMNMLRVVKQGFSQFFNNILTHLWNGLKLWFLSELKDAGIPMITDFTPKGLLFWLLEVLEITAEKIWKKIEDVIGKEKVGKIKELITKGEKIQNATGEAQQFIDDVREKGFVAVIIDKIKQKITNVWDMIFESVRNFVMEKIINNVIEKLLSMLDPTGIMLVVHSCIAIYKAIESFTRYFRRILEIVYSFVDSILEIAHGAIDKAANFLEKALANSMPVAIGFLANQVGLNLSERLIDALDIVRDKVDKALGWIVEKLCTSLGKLLETGKKVVGKLIEWWKIRKGFKFKNGENHSIYLQKDSSSGKLMVASNPKTFMEFVSCINFSDNEKGIMDIIICLAAKIDSTVSVMGLKEKESKQKELLNKEKKYDGNLDEEISDLCEEIRSDIDLLSTHLAKLGNTADLPPSIVKYEGVNEDKNAKQMEATVLSKNIPEGSAPEGMPPIMRKLRRANRGKRTYVQGHLLNNKLGGPGKEFNLTPITYSENSLHHNEVEFRLKELVQKGYVLKYSVEVLYGKHRNKRQIEDKINSALIKDNLSKSERKVLRDKAEFLKFEQEHVTTGLKCFWKFLGFDSKTRQWTDEKTKWSKEYQTVLEKEIAKNSHIKGFEKPGIVEHLLPEDDLDIENAKEI